MTRRQTPAQGFSDDDAQNDPFSGNSFQILINNFVADLGSVDWLLKDSPGWDGVSRAVKHVAQIVERVIEFERRHAKHLLKAAKVNRKPLVDQPFSRHREKEVIGFLRGLSVDALLGCDASERVRQSFGEGRARFDLDVTQAIKAGDAFAPAKRRGDTGMGTVHRRVRTSGDAWTEPGGDGTQESSADGRSPENGRRKLSKTRGTKKKGASRDKCISALSAHHMFSGSSVENYEPIGPQALANMAGVPSKSTASDMFKHVFGSHAEYKRACQDRDGIRLIAKLKILNRDCSEMPTYGSVPPSERERRGDE